MDITISCLTCSRSEQIDATWWYAGDAAPVLCELCSEEQNEDIYLSDYFDDERSSD